MLTLKNSFLQFSIQPERAIWSLFHHQLRGPSLEEVEMGVYYEQGRRQYQPFRKDFPFQPGPIRIIDSPHGPLQKVTLTSGSDPNGLRYQLDFALAELYPFLLWKITIENKGWKPVYVDRIELLNAGFIYAPGGTMNSLTLRSMNRARGAVRPYPEMGELAFYSNGWQSWSYAGVYNQKDRFHHSRLGVLRNPSGVNAGTPQPSRKGTFSSDMFAVIGDRTHRTGILAGFLSQLQHFGSLEVILNAYSPALHMWANGDRARLDPDKSVSTDWACVSFIHLDEADPLGSYLDAVARESSPPGASPGRLRSPDTHIPVGWCSWYQFSSQQYTGTVTPQDVRENLRAVSGLRPALPLEVIQIDDGFETHVGDWFSFVDPFKEGVAGLAQEIRQAGLTPGLWLAPFVVDPRSKLAGQHPDWLLRGKLNRPVNAGFLWNRFATALDLTRQDALEYVQEVVDTAVHRWGFPYLKLDFLYAAALPGHYHDPTRTRAQVLRQGLEIIRKAAGEQTYLLGCGCPLGPAVGLVDAMRISADTARRWQPSFSGIEFYVNEEWDFPAARNASHNALTRAPLHNHWWVNDPDCLLLRPTTLLTVAEVQASVTVAALTGGSLMFSDHLPDLPADRLRIVQALLPLIGKTPHILDWFDAATPSRVQLDLDGPGGRWHLLALFNWQDRPAGLAFHPNEFYLDCRIDYGVRSFWDGKVYRFSERDGACEISFPDVPAHGVVLLAVRPLRSGSPQYLGSDLHISHGLELEAWDPLRDRVRMQLKRPGQASGQVILSLPHSPRQALLNDTPISWTDLGGGSFSFPVQFNQTAQIEVIW